MNDLRSALKGKKTYLAVAIGLLYLLGVWAGFWKFDETVLGALGLSGLAFLRAGVGRTTVPLLLALCILPATVLLGGCARFSTSQSDLRYNEDGSPSTAIVTKARATTLFSSKQLTQWKASQTDRTQGATMGTEMQGATNAAATITALESLIKTVLSNAR